jgi:hypothetical protein
MKIGGIDPKTLPNEEVFVLPRGDKQIVFRAQGLPDLDEFHAMVPEPQAPVVQTPDGIKNNIEDPEFVSRLTEYNKRRLAYIVVHSLKPSAIEWETVKMESPGLWANWENDLKANGITQIECNLVLRLVMEANSLDDAKLKKARETFLRGPQPALTL